jgi:lipid II:glycine glycyltransferase (peptidoglycan interpeptide bridge formation enzyme)
MALEFFRTNNLSSTLLQEVEEFLDSQETGHPFQFPQWLDSGSRFVLLRGEKRIRWVGGFSIHSPFGWKVPWIRAAGANRGPVCDDRRLWAESVDQLAEHLRHEQLTFFDVSPDWIEDGADEPVNVFSNPEWKMIGDEAASLRLDLTRSTDEIFADFSKSTRYEVRRAERAGATVTIAASGAELDEFQRLYRQLAARKGFQPDVAERQRRQISWLMSAPSRGVLLLARIEKTVLGGVVVARAARRCWYIWGASDKRPQLNVGHVLQWHALQWAKSQCCTEYDFGGYTPGATSGPAWFKAGFGGKAVRLIAPRRRVLRPGTYRVFSLLSRIR